jgi:hypothetical protein
MKNSTIMMGLTAALLAVFGASIAFAQAQDKYALTLGKLSFGDFRGYEDWKVVAVSRTDEQVKVIVANDVMINAYKQGLPATGKTFPEGSKVVKIEWKVKKSTTPYPVETPGELEAVATIEKDSKRFPDTHGWAYGAFDFDAKAKSFKAQGTDAKCGYACHTAVASKDYIFTAYPQR